MNHNLSIVHLLRRRPDTCHRHRNALLNRRQGDNIKPSCPEAVVLRVSIIGLSDETIHGVNHSFTLDYPTVFIHKFTAHE